jgi:hypothetical protein
MKTTRHKTSRLEKISNHTLRLDLAVTNVGSGDRAGSSSRSDVLALEVTKEAGVGRGEGTRATKGVVLAAAADEGAADTTTARNSEVLASSAGLDDGSNILIFVAVSQSQYGYWKNTDGASGQPKSKAKL